jgi:hypothetical protein
MKLTNKPSISSVLNTAVNPFAGTLPFEDVYVPKSFKLGPAQSSLDAHVFRTMALAGTYGAAAMGLRAAFNHLEEIERKQKKNKAIHSLVNASMPIMSLDPSTADTKTETKEELLGVKPYLEKEAGAIYEDYEPLKYAVPVAAMSLATYLGYRIANKMHDTSRAAASKTEREKKLNELQALNLKQLYLSRGLNERGEEPVEPEPEEQVLSQAGTQTEGGMQKAASVKDSMSKFIANTQPGVQLEDKTDSVAGTGLAILALLAAGVYAGGAMAGKSYFDSRDENRDRLKKAEEATRNLALLKKPPVIMPMMKTPVLNKLNRTLPGMKPAADPVQAALPAPVSPAAFLNAPVDPTDYAMSNLGSTASV